MEEPLGPGVVSGSATLQAGLTSPGSARRLVIRLCEHAGVSAGVRDTAVLLTSEVVTNAVQHGHGRPRLSAVAGPEGVRVEVGDDSDRSPVVGAAEEDAPGGRGMAIVDGAADAWGVTRDPSGRSGKVVWFELRTSGARGRRALSALAASAS